MPEPLARETDPDLLPMREARRLAVAELAGDAPLVELTPQTASPARLREVVVEGAVVTAFETLELLPDFGEIVATLVALSAERRATVVLALPNGSHGAGRDPGAVAELRALLPEDHVTVHQLALRGSALAPADGVVAEYSLDVEVDPAAEPVAFLIAFGPRADELELTSAVVVQADVSAERAARAALEEELAALRARVAALEARPE